MKLSKLDQKIIYWAIRRMDSQNYEDDELAETMLDELQSLRYIPLDTFPITDKIDRLRTEAKLKRGELVRCGTMLIPTNLESWKGYCKLPNLVNN